MEGPGREIRDVFLKALPGISVAMRGCWGPFEDTEGVSSHFDGAAGRLGRSSAFGSTFSLLVLRCSAKPRALSPSSWSDSARAGL